MQLKLPRMLLIQRRERREFSLRDLLSGDAGTGGRSEWVALAPHLGVEVDLELDDLVVLDYLAAGVAQTRDHLAERYGESRIASLLAQGLLIGDHAEHEQLRQRERALQETAWWTPAAVAHVFGRWQGIDIAADEARDGTRTLKGLFETNGPPPSEALQVRPPESSFPLPAPGRTALDELMQARATCRNFDPGHVLPLADVSAVLHKVFAAQASQVLATGAVALKKNSPSGGGLHPIEAFVLVQRVEGLVPGLYHYQSISHALEPMQMLSAATAASLAHELVAGQAWFTNAPILVLMAARFQRNFWKYRNHAKAWRVIHLDAGHLSQNLYLGATELGYGAFITGAINDECAERLFELDGLATGAIAVCGFGKRAGQVLTTEFDPLGKSRAPATR